MRPDFKNLKSHLSSVTCHQIPLVIWKKMHKLPNLWLQDSMSELMLHMENTKKKTGCLQHCGHELLLLKRENLSLAEAQSQELKMPCDSNWAIHFYIVESSKRSIQSCYWHCLKEKRCIKSISRESKALSTVLHSTEQWPESLSSPLILTFPDGTPRRMSSSAVRSKALHLVLLGIYTRY